MIITNVINFIADFLRSKGIGLWIVTPGDVWESSTGETCENSGYPDLSVFPTPEPSPVIVAQNRILLLLAGLCCGIIKQDFVVF